MDACKVAVSWNRADLRSGRHVRSLRNKVFSSGHGTSRASRQWWCEDLERRSCCRGRRRGDTEWTWPKVACLYTQLSLKSDTVVTCWRCRWLSGESNGELLVAVNHNQLRTMASENVDPIDWLHPPPYTGQYPLSSTYCTLQCGLGCKSEDSLHWVSCERVTFGTPDQRTACAATQGIGYYYFKNKIVVQKGCFQYPLYHFLR